MINHHSDSNLILNKMHISNVYFQKETETNTTNTHILVEVFDFKIFFQYAS